MSFDLAWEKAVKEMAKISPYAVAAKAGCDFSQGKFKLPFFNRTFLVHFPEVKIEEAGTQTPPRQWLEILLLHYLLTSDGSPLADTWITYRYLPGAHLFEQRFNSIAIDRLARAYGNDIDGFRNASLAMGGTPMSRTGDAAYRFMALPCIPMGCMLYLGDEEVSPSVNILFDASAPHYLPTEDLSIIGGYLSSTLQSYKKER